MRKRLILGGGGDDDDEEREIKIWSSKTKEKKKKKKNPPVWAMHNELSQKNISQWNTVNTQGIAPFCILRKKRHPEVRDLLGFGRSVFCLDGITCETKSSLCKIWKEKA